MSQLVPKRKERNQIIVLSNCKIVWKDSGSSFFIADVWKVCKWVVLANPFGVNSYKNSVRRWFYPLDTTYASDNFNSFLFFRFHTSLWGYWKVIFLIYLFSRQQPANCLTVSDHFVGLALKRLVLGSERNKAVINLFQIKVSTQLAFTRSKSTIETQEQCVKSVRSQRRHCQLLTEFIHCSSVSIVDSERISAGWNTIFQQFYLRNIP